MACPMLSNSALSNIVANLLNFLEIGEAETFARLIGEEGPRIGHHQHRQVAGDRDVDRHLAVEIASSLVQPISAARSCAGLE